MSVIHVDVVSATEEIYSGDANCVFAPATMGEIGVYPQFKRYTFLQTT